MAKIYYFQILGSFLGSSMVDISYNFVDDDILLILIFLNMDNDDCHQKIVKWVRSAANIDKDFQSTVKDKSK